MSKTLVEKIEDLFEFIEPDNDDGVSCGRTVVDAGKLIALIREHQEQQDAGVYEIALDIAIALEGSLFEVIRLHDPANGKFSWNRHEAVSAIESAIEPHLRRTQPEQQRVSEEVISQYLLAQLYYAGFEKEDTDAFARGITALNQAPAVERRMDVDFGHLAAHVASALGALHGYGYGDTAAAKSLEHVQEKLMGLYKARRFYALSQETGGDA